MGSTDNSVTRWGYAYGYADDGSRMVFNDQKGWLPQVNNRAWVCYRKKYLKERRACDGGAS